MERRASELHLSFYASFRGSLDDNDINSTCKSSWIDILVVLYRL